MTQENRFEAFGGEAELPRRSFFKAARLGFRCKCPNCGETEIFESYLKVKPVCESCGEELFHHRADDLPAYLNIFVVGHVVIAAMMVIMTYELMGMWQTMFVTIGLCVAASLILMRPLKGMVVGTQWALRMHGFGGHDD